MSISFVNHKEFQQGALSMTIAGALSSLALHVLLGLTGWAALAPFVIPVIAASVMFGSPLLQESSVGAKLAALLGASLFFGGASKSLLASSPLAGAILFAVLFGLFLTKGPGDSRFFGKFIWASLVMGISLFVFARFQSSATLSEMPSWALMSFSGASLGLVGSLGLIPRHVKLEGDKVMIAYARLAKSTGELSDLNQRAFSLWEKSERLLAKDPSARQSLESSILRFFEVSARLQKTDAESGLLSDVTSQITALEEKRAKTTDEQTQKQYDLALQSLLEQQDYAKQINTTKERTLARLHSYLASMEKTRLAIVNHQAASLAEDSTSIKKLLGELEAIGNTFDAEREALAAIEQRA